MATQISVSILTGFLGSGKTTLLNAALQDPRFEKTAVIVNEFGDIALDHLLVETPQDDIIELSSGCLCCEMRGELIDTLRRIIALNAGGEKAVKRIMIEATGLADPIPVMQAIIAHPLLQDDLALASVVTLVDAVNGLETLERYNEAVRQVVLADQIIFTKLDLARQETGLGALTAKVSTLNDRANIKFLEGQQDLFDLFATLPLPSRGDLGGIRGKYAGHKASHPKGAIKRFHLISDAGMEERALLSFLDLLASAHGPKLLRVKGLVKRCDDLHRPVLIHCVQRVMHPPVKLDQWPDDDRRTRLIFITDGIEERFIQKLYDGFSNALRPDTADRQALSDNPLSIAGFRP